MSERRFSFLRDVFPAEYEVVLRRRAAVRASLQAGLDAPPPSEEAAARQAAQQAGPSAAEGTALPSTKHQLVGLALSGGGIRSATFNLGVLQALHRFGVLLQVDYLSTVSGGGYIGACLTSLTRKPGDPFPFLRPRDCRVRLDPSQERDPDPPDYQEPETEAVRYLRGHSNFIMPGGAGDAIRVGAVFLRGVFLNLLIVAPILLAASGALSLLYGGWLRSLLGQPADAVWSGAYTFTPFVLGALLLYFLISPTLTRLLERAIPGLRAAEASGQKPPALRLFERLLLRVLDVADGGRDDRVNWVALRFNLERLLGLGLIAAVGVALFETQAVLIHYFHHLSLVEVDRDLYASVAAGASALSGGLMGKANEKSQSSGSSTAPMIIGFASLLAPVLVYLWIAEALMFTPVLQDLGGLPGGLAVILGALAMTVFNLVVLDVNEQSPHRSYRDALSRSYLVGIDTDNRLGAEDDLKLSQICVDGSTAPYHLVNTALNLQAERSFSSSGRNSDVFIFSKRFIGSEAAGYCPTPVIEEVDPHINLGTAMSISAAAASPNMGSFTVGPLVQLMTLFNIRLGYWAPNPDRVRRHFRLNPDGWSRAHWREQLSGRWRLGRAWDRFPWIAGPSYLFAEMAGSMNLKRRMVNVSDGGHIENLGAYELIRRRCKFLIISDAEADEQLQFGALATLKRFVRIDFGVEIELDLSDLAPDAQGRTVQHAAVGVIRYPARPELGLEAEEGVLLYLKPTFTGDEDQLLVQYRQLSPTYPHESTADQMFDEQQFEAYRALAYHEVCHLLERAFKAEYYERKGLWRVDFAHLFERLRVQLEPRLGGDEAPGQLKEQLGAVEARLASPTLRPYVAQIAWLSGDAEGPPPRAEGHDPSYRQALLLAVNAQLRLMEDVFFTLKFQERANREHSANAGWMVLFRRWSLSPDFQWGYLLSIGTFSKAFRLFCGYGLGLKVAVRWAPASGAELAARGLCAPERLEALAAGGEGEALMACLTVRGQPTAPPVPLAWAWAGPGVAGLARHGLAPAFFHIEGYELALGALEELDPALAARVFPAREELIPEFAGLLDYDALAANLGFNERR